MRLDIDRSFMERLKDEIKVINDRLLAYRRGFVSNINADFLFETLSESLKAIWPLRRKSKKLRNSDS